MRPLWRFRLRRHLLRPLLGAVGRLLCILGLHAWYERGGRYCARSRCRKSERIELPQIDEACPHDRIRPSVFSAHIGTCEACNETGFPLTIEAAYGAVSCHTCCDTGLVPVEVPGRPDVLADGACPACRGGAA